MMTALVCVDPTSTPAAYAMCFPFRAIGCPECQRVAAAWAAGRAAERSAAVRRVVLGRNRWTGTLTVRDRDAERVNERRRSSRYCRDRCSSNDEGRLLLQR